MNRSSSKVRKQGIQISRGKALQATGIVGVRDPTQNFARNVVESRKAKMPEVVTRGRVIK